MNSNLHNMKNLFTINEEEKNRILNLHETATKRQYLSEQSLDLGQSSEPTQPVTTVPTLLDSGAIVKQGIPPDPYIYAKLGNDYYYSKDIDSDNPNWVLAKKEKGINAIKSVIFNEKVPKVKTITPPKKEDKVKTITPPKKEDKKKTTSPKKEENKKRNVVLSNSINPTFKSKLDTSKLSTSKPVPIFNAGQPDCAQFVNDFDDSRTKILNAWIAHDVPDVGNTVWSSFTNLNSDQIDKVTDLWKDINSSSKKGTYKTDVMKLVNSIVPKTSGVSLKLNDVVGLYYPDSSHHEEAFYNDWSKKFFKKNMLGMTVNGDEIKKGKGWGMNTHVGIVGAIDNGVPIIFHNIGSQVWADPYNNLKGDSRIAWVKRA